ncbi:MAG: hypothetical protein WC966_09830 [Bradymonadales bacterium]|jgi:hypothetical protein
MRRSSVFLLFSSLWLFTTLSACSLVFEPAPKAIERLFAGFASGYHQVTRDLCEQNKDLLPKLEQAGGLIASDWYNAREGFYSITSMEKVQDTDTVFVYVDVKVPRTQRDPLITPWVFEMKREKLRWYILSVDGVEEFIRLAQIERGIL